MTRWGWWGRGLVLAGALGLSACGGSSVRTGRAGGRCSVEREGDVTFVRDAQAGFGFSLPPPAAWTVECIDEDNRLVRGHNDEVDAAVTVTVDPDTAVVDETAYLRGYLREARTALQERGLELTQPRLDRFEGATIGLLEVRAREEGEVSVHVAAFSVLRTAAGGWLRFMVILPTEGRFGHRDRDPMVRRAMATAYSFGTLE